jgi:hypothetical protein
MSTTDLPTMSNELEPADAAPIAYSASEKRKQSPGTVNNRDGALDKRPKYETTPSPLIRVELKLQELMSIVKEHPTTSKRIKEELFLLKAIFGTAKSECEEMFDKLKCLTKPNGNSEGLMFRKSLSPNMSLEDIKNAMKLEWPKDAFTKTTLNPRDLSGKHTTFKSILTYPGNYKEDKNYQRLAIAAPEILNLPEDPFQKLGTIEITKNETTAITGLNGSSLARVYSIHPALTSEVGTLEVCDVMTWTNHIRKTIARLNTDRVEVFIPEETNITAIRIIMECSLFDVDVKVLFHVSKEQKKSYQATHGQQSRANNEDIIVKTKDGSSFADVVKDLKQHINPEQLGVEVKHMSATLNGHVRIRVTERNPGSKRAMVEKIQDLVKSADKASISHRTKGIVIMDLDCDVDKDELIKTLRTELNLPTEDIYVNPFRRMRMGNQMVTVFLPREAADRAVEMRRIKIGWTQARIKERYDPPFCQKCQVFGHNTATCKTTEFTSKRCLNCGEGHPTSQCTNPNEYCITCKTPGHRANSMRCPVYKELINGRK